MSNRGKKYRFVTREAMMDEIELNTSKGDTNLCIRCKEFIPTVYKKGIRDRSNRVDCDDEDGTVSYHLVCYDLEMFGHITRTTQRKIDLNNSRE